MIKQIVQLSLCLVLFSFTGHAEDKPRQKCWHFDGDDFQSVTVTATNITIKLKSYGPKFRVRRSDGTVKMCEYGEEINVAIGESVKIIERHHNITFSALPAPVKGHGFNISEELDMRSFGKELKTNRVFMITSEIKGGKDVKDASVTFLEPTINAVEEFFKKEKRITSQNSTNELTVIGQREIQ